MRQPHLARRHHLIRQPFLMKIYQARQPHIVSQLCFIRLSHLVRNPHLLCRLYLVRQPHFVRQCGRLKLSVSVPIQIMMHPHFVNIFLINLIS